MENPNPSSGNSGADNTIQRGVESAGAALHSSIDKVAEPARSAVDRMSSAAHETVDKVAHNATQAADQFSDQTRRLSEVPNQALECSRSWVKDRPLEAVGLAVALGFVVGRLTAR